MVVGTNPENLRCPDSREPSLNKPEGSERYPDREPLRRRFMPDGAWFVCNIVP